MLKIISLCLKCFSFVFPPSEDEVCINNLSIDTFLSLQRTQQTKTVTTLLSYADQPVRSAVHLLKFHNHAKSRRLLGNILAVYLENLQQENKELLLVPVPLSSKRFRQRGYNQVTEIIKEALKQGAPGTLADTILKRACHTTPQTSLSREKRLTNLKGAFCIAPQQLTDTHLILIDDVTTTGATLAEAKTALVPLSPACITCIALAH